MVHLGLCVKCSSHHRSGKNLVDFTYVENVVHGHILAAETLRAGSPTCGQVSWCLSLEHLIFSLHMDSLFTAYSLSVLVLLSTKLYACLFLYCCTPACTSVGWHRVLILHAVTIRSDDTFN